MVKLNRFNWIAASYDYLVDVVFGNTLHLAQIHFISEISDHDKILILGGGSGKFLNTLLQNRPSVSVIYVEASSKMISLASKQVYDHSRVTFIHGTQDNIPDQKFDIVITNFFLDLFREDQIEQMVSTISRSLRSEGKWIVTDFENTSWFSHRILLKLMYGFFRVTGSIDAKRLPLWRETFGPACLRLTKEKFYRNGFVSTSVFIKKM